MTLPAKGAWVELGSMTEAGDALFDVALTVNCMGAAVLVYTAARAIDSRAAAQVASALGARLLQPFGPAVGLCYIDSDRLGKAVLQLGSCELRLTLLLGVALDCRAQFEAALLAAFDAAPGPGEKRVPLELPRLPAQPLPSI